MSNDTYIPPTLAERIRAAGVHPGRCQITPIEAAIISGLSYKWHETHRREGDGPPYIKVGQRVLYPLADYLAWFEARKATGGR